MKINKLLKQPNVTITVAPTDLEEFAQTIIERTISEMSKMGEYGNERYLTLDETAAKLNVSKNTLWRWNKIGYLCPVKAGRNPLYPLSVIEQLLNNDIQRITLKNN